MPKFSKSSKDKLKTCDSRLQELFNEVIKYIDCTIVCGHRGEEEQNSAYLNGFSKLKFPKSKHNKLPSLAVDVIPYPTGYEDIEMFQELADVVFDLAGRLKIRVRWGGGWKKFVDKPHWEIIET